MKNITERHQLILQELKKTGSVGIQQLSDLMQVSGVTIRKDLKLLEDKNLLFRTHGGGSINNPYAIERPINEKEFINSEEKQRIAKEALKLIRQNDSIMIGSGTTVFELARCLHPTKQITVITPAVKVTLELSNRPHVEAGSYAEYILENVSCGVLFIGVDGIDFDFGLSISNLTEAGLNQKMINTAQSVAVLADHTKFGKRGIGKICDLDQIQYIITDSGVSRDTVKSLEDRGVKVLIAEK
jgi:DeoR family transcriptional regulator of aga operon